MKKDIEWAKKEIKELMTEESQNYPHDEMVEKEIVLGILNQLDEPEVKQLERKIKELESFNDGLIRDNYRFRNELDNQEVLSQELPVIPKFVAEWYESEGKRNSWWNWFYKWGRDESRTELETKTIRWMQDFNEEIFVNMFLHGYEVEEEQKYYVEDGKHTLLCKWESSDGWKVISTIESAEDDLPIEVLDFELTEQEIKDYDERYWAFTKPVKELEQ